MASKKQEAANARARSLGFKNAYDRRVQNALLKGKSKQAARGNHPKETKVRIKTPLPTKYHIVPRQGKRKPFDINLSKDQAKEIARLEKMGKPETARVYALAVAYNVPLLAGIDRYQPGMDYDTGGTLPDYSKHSKSKEAAEEDYDGYDYEELEYFDWYDIPDEDDPYAI